MTIPISSFIVASSIRYSISPSDRFNGEEAFPNRFLKMFPNATFEEMNSYHSLVALFVIAFEMLTNLF